MAIYAVTGGAGFIGSHIVEALCRDKHQVVIIDNLHSGSLRNVEHISSAYLKIINCDIRDYERLLPCLSGVDYVIHMAGLADIVPSIEDPNEYYSVNVTGTLNTLRACVAQKVKKLVYAASSSCYGIPTEIPTSEVASIKCEHPYALTKFLGEQLVLHWMQVYGLKATSLRLFNVYGPRSRTSGAYGAVLGVFLAQKLAGVPFTVVGDGEQRRDFVFVSDVARAFIIASNSGSSDGAIINIGAGKPQTVNYLTQLLEGQSINLPKRPGEPDVSHADISKAKNILTWAPEVSFESGVKAVLEVIEDWSNAPVWTEEKIAEATATWFSTLSGRCH